MARNACADLITVRVYTYLAGYNKENTYKRLTCARKNTNTRTQIDYSVSAAVTKSKILLLTSQYGDKIYLAILGTSVGICD
jgi:hypothetical protein